MEEIYILGGEFKMGAEDSDRTATSDTKPLHLVYLDPFWIDQHEVTNYQYALCVQDGFCTPPDWPGSTMIEDYYGNPQYDNFPVINVNWFQAERYCEWIGGKLPSEAEWENAASGNDDRIYPWGNAAPGPTYLDYDGDTSSEIFFSEVCSYPAGNSPFGLCDMAGNVSEWIHDWYDPVYYETSPYENPTGPVSGEDKGVRGGNWGSPKRYFTVYFRAGTSPDRSLPSIGFRCSR